MDPKRLCGNCGGCTVTEDIAVVKPYYAVEEAYKMGFEIFENTWGEEDTEDPHISHFKSSAEWANHVAPTLRSMAGFADSGHGTYQQERKVAAIKPGCEEDTPAAAELVEARYIYQTIVEAFDMGAYDALAGNELEVPELW